MTHPPFNYCEVHGPYLSAVCGGCAVQPDAPLAEVAEVPQPPSLADLLEQAAEAAMRAKMFVRGTPHEAHYAVLASRLEAAALNRPAVAPGCGDAYCVRITGDGERADVVIGDDEMRRYLREQFFGPDPIPETYSGPREEPTHHEQEQGRWRDFCDPSRWEDGEWRENGEDYCVIVFRAQLPAPPRAAGTPGDGGRDG